MNKELIETVMTTIQEPEVTDAGVAAVVSRLQAYSAGISGMVNRLPPETTITTAAVTEGGATNRAMLLPKIEKTEQ